MIKLRYIRFTCEEFTDLICDECGKMFVEEWWTFRKEWRLKRLLVFLAQEHGWLRICPADRYEEYHFCSDGCYKSFFSKRREQ